MTPRSLPGLGIKGSIGALCIGTPLKHSGFDSRPAHVKQLPLDEPTYLRVKWGLEHARLWGHDPAEQLHELELILTPAKEQQIKLEAMNFLLAEIQGWRPAEFIRRTDKSGTGATPADLHRAVCDFIQDHINAVKAGG